MIEQNKERLKRNQDKETSGTTLNALTFILQGAPEEEQKGRGSEKIIEDFIAKNFPDMERKQPSKLRKY